MISFLKSNPGTPVPDAEIRERYNRLRWHALFGIFIGYAAFYILRNNFLLSSPELISDFGFTKKDIGFISGTMLIVYGLSKGFMSAIADKSNPKHFMIFGLMMSAIVNLMMGFSASFWAFLLLCVLNGIFQGMGVGPAYIILANWFPRKSRGVTTAIFNISHNVGGGVSCTNRWRKYRLVRSRTLASRTLCCACSNCNYHCIDFLHLWCRSYL